MFSSIFSKKENHLDGKSFKQRFETIDKAELLDVRTSGEFSSGSIPGAKNLDLMAPDFQS